MQVKKGNNGDKTDPTERKIDPEDPSPSDILGKRTANDRSSDRPQCPDSALISKPRTSLT